MNQKRLTVYMLSSTFHKHIHLKYLALRVRVVGSEKMCVCGVSRPWRARCSFEICFLPLRPDPIFAIAFGPSSMGSTVAVVVFGVVVIDDVLLTLSAVRKKGTRRCTNR
jgi:hypothetical protein